MCIYLASEIPKIRKELLNKIDRKYKGNYRSLKNKRKVYLLSVNSNLSAFTIGGIYDTIFFGKKLKRKLECGCRLYNRNKRKGFKSRKQQDKINFLINHETFHNILEKHIGITTSRCFDNIDVLWGISEFNTEIKNETFSTLSSNYVINHNNRSYRRNYLHSPFWLLYIIRNSKKEVGYMKKKQDKEFKNMGKGFLIAGEVTKETADEVLFIAKVAVNRKRIHQLLNEEEIPQAEIPLVKKGMWFMLKNLVRR